MLNKIGKSVRQPRLIVHPDGITQEMQIPAQWVELLSQQTRMGKADVSAIWKEYEPLLPGVMAFLREKVRGVCILLENNAVPSLLYVYSRGDNDYFYRGRLTRSEPSDPVVWNRLPESLRDFYTSVHNGWTQLASDAIGPLRFEDVTPLSEFDWDLDEEEQKRLPFDLETTYTTFSNGGGDYLCIDTATRQYQNNAVIWWHERPLQPYCNLDFWAVLDNWVCGQVEDVYLA